MSAYTERVQSLRLISFIDRPFETLQAACVYPFGTSRFSCPVLLKNDYIHGNQMEKIKGTLAVIVSEPCSIIR